MIYKRARFIALLFVAIFIFYFTNDFAFINIEKTALIVTVGIDKNDNDYTVTTQIAVPEGSANQATNNESVLSANGKTVYDAISKIGEQTGWYPKLSFCNLIVLGENMLEDNVMDVIDFFLRSYKVEDSAILCACSGTAKELLLSSSPLDNISGLSLSKIFVRDYRGASKLMPTSIKEFSLNYYSHSHFGFMPTIKTVLTDENGKGGKTASTSTLTKPSSGDSGADSEQQLVIYDASESLIFNNGYCKTILTGDESLCFSLLSKHVNEAFINVTAVSDDGTTGDVLISLDKSRHEVNLKIEDDKPKLIVKVKLWLKVSDTNFSESIQSISTLGKLNDNMLFACKTFVENNLKSVYQKTKNAGCDLFEIKNLLYRRHYKYYKKHEHTVLEDFTAEFNVQCYNYI